MNRDSVGRYTSDVLYFMNLLILRGKTGMMQIFKRDSIITDPFEQFIGNNYRENPFQKSF